MNITHHSPALLIAKKIESLSLLGKTFCYNVIMMMLMMMMVMMMMTIIVIARTLQITISITPSMNITHRSPALLIAKKTESLSLL